MLSVTAA